MVCHWASDCTVLKTCCHKAGLLLLVQISRNANCYESIPHKVGVLKVFQPADFSCQSSLCRRPIQQRNSRKIQSVWTFHKLRC
jgi:hypothetical protein